MITAAIMTLCLISSDAKPNPNCKFVCYTDSPQYNECLYSHVVDVVNQGDLKEAHHVVRRPDGHLVLTP